MVNSPVVSTADSASGWSSPGVAQLPCVPSRSLLTVPPGWSSTLVPCWGRPSALPVRTPVPVRQVLASHRYQPNHHDRHPGRPALRPVPDTRDTPASRPRDQGGPPPGTGRKRADRIEIPDTGRQSIRRGVPSNPTSASVGCVVTYCRSRSEHHRVTPSTRVGRASTSARGSPVVRPSSAASSGDIR